MTKDQELRKVAFELASKMPRMNCAPMYQYQPAISLAQIIGEAKTIEKYLRGEKK